MPGDDAFIPYLPPILRMCLKKLFVVTNKSQECSGLTNTRAAGSRQGTVESLLKIGVGPAKRVGCSSREVEEAPGRHGEVCAVVSGCELAGQLPQPVHATCLGARWAGAREGSHLAVQRLQSRFMICFACNPVSRLHNCNSETFTVSLT